MKAYRYLTILVMSLVVIGISIQPVSAYYVTGRSDSTGYNHQIKGLSSAYSQIFLSTSTGELKAHGVSVAFGGQQNGFLEVGYRFDAQEDGRFKAAAVWTSIFQLVTWQDYWLHGRATMKVEYILFTSGYQFLESKSVWSAVSDSTDEHVVGQPSKSLANYYWFSTNLEEGLSYILAVRLSFTMIDGCRIDGLSYNSAAYIDVNSIVVWNGPGVPY